MTIQRGIASTAAIAALVSVGAVPGGHPRCAFGATVKKACSVTARAVKKACVNEASDDFWIAVGVCTNLSDAAARKECLADARDGLGEARSECAEQVEARMALCDALGEAPYDPVIDPASFLSPAATAASPNTYFPLVPGTIWVYQGNGETVTVTVTDQTKEILGVTTMVVRDTVERGGEVVEDTEDYFAQQVDGTVWYFGELSKEFENGDLVSLEGSFRAGVEGAKAGIIMEAAPAVGDVYRQEFALGNAEDAAEVTATTGTESVPAASCAGNCLVTRDFTPISPGADETKYYAPGVGFILEIDPATGERLELVSVSP